MTVVLPIFGEYCGCGIANFLEGVVVVVLLIFGGSYVVVLLDFGKTYVVVLLIFGDFWGLLCY